MRVTADDYRIYPLKKAGIAYILFLSVCVLLYLSVPSDVLDNKSIQVVLLSLYFCVQLSISCLAIWYGRKVIEAKISPPPGTWVLSNWKVYTGKKAYLGGWVYVISGLIIMIMGVILFAEVWLWLF